MHSPGHPSCPWLLPWPGTSPCSLVAIPATDIDNDLCQCRAKDPDMALSVSSGWDFTVAPGAGLTADCKLLLSTQFHVSP